MRLVIKKKNRKNLPEILSLKINGDDKCNANKRRTTTSRPVAIGEFDSIFDEVNININIKCGRRKINDDEKLISSGQKSKEGAWPWHAAIYHFSDSGIDQSYKCGGSIMEMDGVKFIVRVLLNLNQKI